jgi:hypothetical protein
LFQTSEKDCETKTGVTPGHRLEQGDNDQNVMKIVHNASFIIRICSAKLISCDTGRMFAMAMPQNSQFSEFGDSYITSGEPTQT